MTPSDIKQLMQDHRRKVLEHFPFKLIETRGSQALSKWEDLKCSGRGYPVVLGGYDESEHFDNLLMPFDPTSGFYESGPPEVETTLSKAARIRFPDDLAASVKADADRIREQFKAQLSEAPDMTLPEIIEVSSGATRAFSREEVIAAMECEPTEPPLGEWPTSPEGALALSVAHDLVSGTPLGNVYVCLVPTTDWTEVPAYLRWGGWDACPAAEYHVAAMRRWRDSYGAELVGMSSDTINLRVATFPKTRDEALDLARDQYVYCSDIIDQGVGTYSALAAALMVNNWWYFWWD